MEFSIPLGIAIRGSELRQLWFLGSTAVYQIDKGRPWAVVAVAGACNTVRENELSKAVGKVLNADDHYKVRLRFDSRHAVFSFVGLVLKRWVMI